MGALYLTDREGFGDPVGWTLMRWRGADYPTLRIDVLRGHGPQSALYGAPKKVPAVHHAQIDVHGEEMIVPVLARLLMLGVEGTIEEEPWGRPAC